MATPPRDHSLEIAALRPRLLEWANALTRDPAEALALVEETLSKALASEDGPPDLATLRAWTHRLLRQRFYSVERDRVYRRSRGGVANLEQVRRNQSPETDPASETPHAA